MGKRILLAAVAVFVAWGVLDFVIHGMILRGAYESTASLWRPQGEMKMTVMYVASLIAALCFAAIYGWLVAPKSTRAGLTYGLLWGVGGGAAMGYGSYSVMPIPYMMALGWFLGTIVEGIVAGLLVGLIARGES